MNDQTTKKYKEFKKVLKNVLIDNVPNFTNNLRDFLNDHPDIKIIQIIKHQPYHITIIYELFIPL
jgi:hypothetical protein